MLENSVVNCVGSSLCYFPLSGREVWWILSMTKCLTLQYDVCFPPGSVPSLAAGLLFGGLAGLGAYQLSQDPRNIWVFLGMSASLSPQSVICPAYSTTGPSLVGCVRFLTLRQFHCFCPVQGRFLNWGREGGHGYAGFCFYVQNVKRFSYLMNLDLPSEISIKLV